MTLMVLATEHLLLVKEITRQQQEDACSQPPDHISPWLSIALPVLHLSNSSPPRRLLMCRLHRAIGRLHSRIGGYRTGEHQINKSALHFRCSPGIVDTCSPVPRAKKIMCMGLSPYVDVAELRESSSFAWLLYLLPYLSGLQRASEDC